MTRDQLLLVMLSAKITLTMAESTVVRGDPAGASSLLSAAASLETLAAELRQCATELGSTPGV